MTDNELLEKFNQEYPLKELNLNNRKWEYLVKGSGEITFLILPGGGQYAQSQYRLAKVFSQQYKVIIPSIYGVYSIADCCQLIDEILKLEKADKVIVYGLSIGALIAQSYVKRNLHRTLKLIISHGSAPTSPTYAKKVVRPLYFLNIILPFIPPFLIKFTAKNWSGRIQGFSKNITKDFDLESIVKDEEEDRIRKLLAKKFYQIYLTKKLLRTWIRLHFDFYYNERFSSEKLKDWSRNILILKTDNDPLMQDDGEFKKMYPHATIRMFNGTGHLTVIYQFTQIAASIKDFLRN